MNQGVHTIDQLPCLAGEAESVFAGTKARSIEVEDTAVALVQFESGLMASLKVQPRSILGKGLELNYMVRLVAPFWPIAGSHCGPQKIRLS